MHRTVLAGGILVLFSVLVIIPERTSPTFGTPGSAAHPNAIRGRMLVSFRQERGEQDYFAYENGVIRSRLSSYSIDQLKTYGLRRCGKGYHRHGRAIYVLAFDGRRSDDMVEQYLKTLPGVEYVQRDYYPTFCLEPDDFFYQPDSVGDSTRHWVPYDYNIVYGNTGTRRQCSSGMFDCCTEDQYIYPCETFRDSLHLSDQWYLQFVQANKAWDIETGDPNVLVMVMDSGIDDAHPDLSANMWCNSADDFGDADHNGLPGGSGDDDGKDGWNFNDSDFDGRDLDGDGQAFWGMDGICDAGPDGDYGFGPNGIDDPPDGPGGGDDDTFLVGTDPWDDNLRGPWSQNPNTLMDDDLDEIPFFLLDDDENGYPDDYHGVNFYDPLRDWPNSWEQSGPDGIPGVKGWIVDYYDGSDSVHFNDVDVRNTDFNGNGIPLCGPDGICDAGPDGDYGFGPNAIDDPPFGPGGGDDDTLLVGTDPWDDNRRGPGSPLADSLPDFDDDMTDVYFLRFDNEEDSHPLSLPVDDSCPKANACHGTNMAGIIGAETNNTEGMAGFMWYCSMVAAKIAIGFPESAMEQWQDNPTDSDLFWGAVIPMIRAFDYAIEKDVSVINMSLTFYRDTLDYPMINRAIERAYDAGIVMVASTGNAPTEDEAYPADHPYVISVTGSNRFGEKATYVTCNENVECCAPVSERGAGEPNFTTDETGCYPAGTKIYERGADCIVTAFFLPPAGMLGYEEPNRPHAYSTTSLATSGAAAQVSGLAGLLCSMYPRISFSGTGPEYVEFIRDEIARGCVALDDTFYTQGKLGTGRINAYRSLTQWGDTDGRSLTWSGDVYVSADIVVLEDDTLTILPGTTVYFMPEDNDSLGYSGTRTALYVRGYLNVAGTSGNPVQLRAFGDFAPAGSWEGIRLLGDEATARLSHCTIRDARYGLKSHLTVSMRGCEVRNCFPCGVYLYETGGSENASTLDHCTISHNDSTDATGLRIWNCLSDSMVVVDSCDVDYNYLGVWISNASPQLRYTDIKHNETDGVFAAMYQCVVTPDPYVYWCEIESNGERGIVFEGTAGDVSNTRIAENADYGIHCIGTDTQPEIRNSKIEDNAYGLRNYFGTPVLGDTAAATGKNNTLDNDSYNVYQDGAYMLQPTIMAEQCYWGTYPPSAGKISGKVDYVPALEEDPVAYLARSADADRGAITKVMLYQNFPNPLASGGMTQIKYSLPSTQRVTLRIYDVAGRRIRTLVDGMKPPGHHYERWDGRNDRGSRVAPGIYFYQLCTGAETFSKKIVLLH